MLHHRPQCRGTIAMPELTRKTTLLGPSPIPVHDDRNVPRDPRRMHIRKMRERIGLGVSQLHPRNGRDRERIAREGTGGRGVGTERRHLDAFAFHRCCRAKNQTHVMIVCARSGPTLTASARTWVVVSMNSTYARAAAGRSAIFRQPEMSCEKPAKVL